MNPFTIHTPSVFIITSPFQALCCLAAIRNFEIDEYEIIFIPASSTIRNSQTINFFKKNNILYRIVNPKIRNRFPYFIKALIPKRNKYKRLFIGDFRNFGALYLGLGIVSKGSGIVYLDDGNITISLLEGTYKHKKGKAFTINMKIAYMLSHLHSVLLFKNMYTIYDKIPNPNYRIFENDLTVILDKRDCKRISGVYIIGTVIDVYCEHLGISNEVFVDNMDYYLRRLKEEYPSEDIIYVAHGRDDGTYSLPLCGKYGIKFVRPELIIELYMLEIPAIPRLITGFNSSALLNLKKMIRGCDIRNYLIISNTPTSQTDRYLSVAEYYEKNEILTEKIIVKK